MEWTDAQHDRLRLLWPDLSLSTAAIGRDIGVTKNSIVGKAHRLDLPKRPSPIRRSDRPAGVAGAPRAPRPGRARGTLPPLASSMAVPTAARPPATAAPRPPASQPAAARASNETCAYPYGDPGTKGFHWCGKPALCNSPYCFGHDEDCHVKVRTPILMASA